MLYKFLFIVFLLGVSCVYGADEPSFEFKRTTAKNPVAVDRPIICESSTAAATVGFYVPPEMLGKDLAQESVTISSQTKPSIWKIEIHGNAAKVTYAGGPLGEIQTSDYVVSFSSPKYLALVSVEGGTGIHTITVDAVYGTFVYTTNGQSPFGLGNRANVFWGRCRN